MVRMAVFVSTFYDKDEANTAIFLSKERRGTVHEIGENVNQRSLCGRFFANKQGLYVQLRTSRKQEKSSCALVA